VFGVDCHSVEKGAKRVCVCVFARVAFRGVVVVVVESGDLAPPHV